MKYEKFKQRLEFLGLTLKSFSEMTGVPLGTVKGWGTTRPKKPEALTPSWVSTLLDILKRNKELEAAVKILKEK